MTLREQLVQRAMSFVTDDLSLKTLSYRLTGDGKILPKLARGDGDVTTTRYEDIMGKLDEMECESTE
jgi:hypothetical protein